MFISLSLFAESNNMLTNPGFEWGNTDGWAHWCITSKVTAMGEHSGTYCVELSTLGLPDEYDQGGLIQEVTEGFSIGMPLYAGAWLKPDNLNAEVFLKLEFWNEAGSLIDFVEGRRITGTKDWTKSVVFIPAVPDDTTTVKIVIRLSSNTDKGINGKVYLDDTYLEVAPEPDV